MTDKARFYKGFSGNPTIKKMGYSNPETGYSEEVAMVKVDMWQYQQLLERLRRNRQSVPVDELRTRYHKSYMALLEEIRDMTKQLIQDIVLDGLQIKRDGAEATYWAINQAIDESELLAAIQAAVFQEQDFDKVMGCAKQLRVIVHQVSGGMDG